MRKKEFVVLGLGRFGSSLASALAARGHSVLGIDRDRDVVQRLSNELEGALVLDATVEEALREAGVEDFDVAVVGIGKNFESNIVITHTLRDMGIRRIVCKGLTERQKRILLGAGAHEVVLPEHEAGMRLAERLTAPEEVRNRVELAEGILLEEVVCPAPLVGSTLEASALRSRYGLTLVTLKGPRTVLLPAPSEVFQAGDLLVVLGRTEDLRRFEELGL